VLPVHQPGAGAVDALHPGVGHVVDQLDIVGYEERQVLLAAEAKWTNGPSTPTCCAACVAGSRSCPT